MTIQRYDEGPLKGMISIAIVIDADAARFLDHAANGDEDAIIEIARSSVEEAARGYARERDLT